MVIKSYKLFERGDGVEDDSRVELDSEGKYTIKGHLAPVDDYILGIPSGEIIYVNDKELDDLIDRKSVYYVNAFRGQNLNCYCAPDKDFEYIKGYLLGRKWRAESSGKKRETDDDYESVCREFEDLMSRVLVRREIVIAYIPKLNGIDYYYAIIPDLSFNKAFYNTKMPMIIDVCRLMKAKYPDSVFTTKDRLIRSDVKYYGLPKEKDTSNDAPGIMTDYVIDAIKAELEKNTKFQYRIGEDEKDGKRHFHIIGEEFFLDGPELDNVREVVNNLRKRFKNCVFDYIITNGYEDQKSQCKGMKIY